MPALLNGGGAESSASRHAQVLCPVRAVREGAPPAGVPEKWVQWICCPGGTLRVLKDCHGGRKSHGAEVGVLRFSETGLQRTWVTEVGGGVLGL